MNNNDENESSSFKDKIMGLYSLGVIGFASMNYSADGIWLAIGKALIWPLSVGLYLIEKFS